MFKNILATILHHANRHSKDPKFYAIKNRLVKKHGEFIGHDVQHVEGKKCFSCGGTGEFHSWSSDYIDQCYKCDGTGWYKDPFWTILEKYKFGKHTFHQPLKKVYKKPDIETNVNGYISHNYTEYGGRAVMLLYLLFDFSYFVQCIKGMGLGWRYYWWKPRNWIPCIAHILRYKSDSYPFRSLKKPKLVPVHHGVEIGDDELPF